MHISTALTWQLVAFAAGSAARIVATDNVPLIGPSFIPNFNLSNSSTIQQVKTALPKVIDGLFESGSLNRTDLIFAVDVFSAATNSSIFNYHHVGEGKDKALTAGKLSDKTIGRLGSVTKLFTVYALLAKAGIEIFHEPVTKYLPELMGNSPSKDDILKHVRWEDVTIGALASHQAGSGGVTDFIEKYTNQTEMWTPEELLKHMRDEKHPVISPFRNAVYSDGGFAILTQVLARLVGQPYEKAIEEVLFKPLGLDHTSATVPNGTDVDGINRQVLKEGLSAWGADIEIVAGSGGIYSNGEDLRTVGLSILNSELLSPAVTQQWMKPLSGTGSLVELVGAPWEITRLMLPVSADSNRSRVSDLYIKAGGNGDYTCVLGLSPDHGIGFSILVAGSTASDARWWIRDAVGETFIPAAEFAAVDNAKQNLAGVFVNDNSDGTNITLTVDKDQPGLGIGSYYVEGVDTVNGTSARIYPTGLNSYSRSLASLYKSQGKFSVAHRQISQKLPLKPRTAVEGGKGGLFDHSFAWQSIDFAGPTDEFVLNLVDGRLESVTAPGSGLVFKRAD